MVSVSLRAVVIMAALFLSLVIASVSAAEPPLRLAFIPQENPEKLLGDVSAVAKILSDQMQMPVEALITIDHAAAVEALRNGDADIAFMGALPFVLAESHIGAVPLLSEVYRGSSVYKSRIFVRRDSGIKTLQDLKDRDIAFADPISESGYLYPLDLFFQAGLIETPDKSSEFFNQVYFAGGYQQAMQALAGGLVDAAGASQYADLLLSAEQQSEVMWLEESPDIPAHLVIARKGLPQEIQDLFVDVMLSFNEPENRHVLSLLYGPDGYEKTEAARYHGVRDLAKRYGLLP